MDSSCGHHNNVYVWLSNFQGILVSPLSGKFSNVICRLIYIKQHKAAWIFIGYSAISNGRDVVDQTAWYMIFEENFNFV